VDKIPPIEIIIEAIEIEIARLKAARAMPAGDSNSRTVGKPGSQNRVSHQDEN
jgi:hypothetical protein